MTVPSLAWATLMLAVALGVTAGGFFLARKLAGNSGDDGATPDAMLSKFRDLHARGGLSDAEFRNIKTKLAPNLGGNAAAGRSEEESASVGSGA